MKKIMIIGAGPLQLPGIKKAKEMGADYVISASAIDGYEERGLKLLTAEPISSEDCWYKLYVYEIMQ